MLCQLLQEHIHVCRSFGRLSVHIHRIPHHKGFYILLLSVSFEIFYYLCSLYRIQGRSKYAERIANRNSRPFAPVIYAYIPVHWMQS